jgi:hypothetical protein
MLSWLRRHIDVIVFSLSLLVLVFGYGVAVGKYRLFPHDQINAAMEAAGDWWENWRHFARLESKWMEPTHRTQRIAWRDPARTYDGYTFVTGFLDGASGIYLIDMEGNIVHRWPFSMDQMWEISGMPAEELGAVDLSIHGAVLYPDGDVVVSVGGGALSRLDRCGNFVYATAIESHHAVDLLPDGSVLTLGRWTETEEREDRPRVSPGPNGYYLDDTLAHVSADGEILYERSLIDILFASDMGGMLLLGDGSSYRSTVQDPLHVNDVEYLTAKLAPAFPEFETGDILVSMRNIATLVVLDGDTKTVKWFTTGPFFGQHDPDFTPDGTIMVYDNRITGDDGPELGYSRVLEIDVATKEVVWEYVGTDEDPMYSSLGGRVQILPNGNVLALEPQGGRIIEIARDDENSVVWEFVNIQGEGEVGMLFDGIRFAPDELDFVGKPCP